MRRTYPGADDTMPPAWRLGRVVRQRPAKPRTPVRLRQAPLPFSLHFTREGEAAGRPVRTVSRSMRFPRPPVPRGDRVKPNNRALRLLAGATAVAASAAAAALS